MLAADFKTTLDACVLANQSVCDLFLRLAETPRLYVPVWSAEILDEVRRTHVDKLEWPTELADYWQSEVKKHFPEAAATGYTPFIPLAQNESKDKHVLAVAICANSALIITFNLKHFPHAALEPFGVKALHPAEYLITLYGMNPGVVVSKIEAMARAAKRTPEQMISLLGRSVPAFALHVADALDWQLS